jgi:hypothetical protein
MKTGRNTTTIKRNYKELGHDSNNQQQSDEMEERYCYFIGFIQTKMKELEFAGAPELNINTEPSVKVKLTQLSIPKFSGNLKDWVTFKDTFLSLVGDSTTLLQHISISKQGFRAAWEILVEIY